MGDVHSGNPSPWMTFYPIVWLQPQLASQLHGMVRLTKLSGQQIKPLTTSQLGRFCTDTHKLINSSNHNLANQQIVTKVQDNIQNVRYKKFKRVTNWTVCLFLPADTVLVVASESDTVSITMGEQPGQTSSFLNAQLYKRLIKQIFFFL